MSLTDPGREIPDGPRTGEFVLRPITADDAEADHEAVMETRELLRSWEQSTWPAEDFTVAANRRDLVDLERRHAERRAFTWTVRDPADTTCLGCVYAFPTGATFLVRSAVTAVADDDWAAVDAVVFFWVRLSRMGAGTDARLLATLRSWFSREWGLHRTVFVTSELFVHQVELLDSTDLTVRFEIREPGKPARYLAYG